MEKEEARAEEQRQEEEKERRRIQDVLNKQTFAQFKVKCRDGADIRLFLYPVLGQILTNDLLPSSLPDI